jgi:hypothetical protein
MTIRQQIFETLKTGLLRIQVSNGYSHDINKVIPVLRTLDEMNEFPSVVLIPGEESTRADYEDRNMFECSFELVILTHIETFYDLSSEGLFTSEAESWIEDYQRFIANDDIQTGCILALIEGVENFYLSKAIPYSDWRDNKQTLEVTITVQYIKAI